MIHQSQYKWLEKETSPKVINELVKIWGTKEIVGKKNNPIILDWAKKLDLHNIYTNDEIPWCGLLVAKIIHEAGFEVVKNPLWARSWLNFGTIIPNNEAKLGDILIFERPGGGGHVAFYLGEDKACFHIGGGNQNNMVNGTRILRNRLLGVRRCTWKISEPKGVRKIILNSTEIISTNEA